MAMGLSLGHITPESLGLVTLVGLITIALSVYMITYSHTLYVWLEPLLGIFERRIPVRELNEIDESQAQQAHDILLFGLGRYGSALAQRLHQQGFTMLAVDFNPDEVKQWQAMGYHVIYGDACDPEFISHLPLNGVKCVISAMSQHSIGVTHEDPNLMLLDALKAQHYKGIIAVSAQQVENMTEIELLKQRGAALVFQPYYDAAEQAADKLKALLASELR